MEHPWRADWLSARWIYTSTNLSGIFRLHAIQFATICADNQKAQVGTKDWTAFFWAMHQAIFLAFTLLILGVWQLVDAGWYSNEYRHFFLSTSMLVWVNFGVHSSSISTCPSDHFVQFYWNHPMQWFACEFRLQVTPLWNRQTVAQ